MNLLPPRRGLAGRPASQGRGPPSSTLARTPRAAKRSSAARISDTKPARVASGSPLPEARASTVSLPPSRAFRQPPPPQNTPGNVRLWAGRARATRGSALAGWTGGGQAGPSTDGTRTVSGNRRNTVQAESCPGGRRQRKATKIPGEPGDLRRRERGCRKPAAQPATAVSVRDRGSCFVSCHRGVSEIGF